ncbi:hypothetical protein Dda_1985 [Drechslerella dactyloides]|uniref:Uncharacterized protein n=1 Tax=Drechslerella dactyloides TaxID=74499 RepID=A0AAD6NM93_DREDA|nr:hypothetical protein Dda_1985 [Drechslerella dactyloides]
MAYTKARFCTKNDGHGIATLNQNKSLSISVISGGRSRRNAAVPRNTPGIMKPNTLPAPPANCKALT